MQITKWPLSIVIMLTLSISIFAIFPQTAFAADNNSPKDLSITAYNVWCNGERFASDNLTIVCGDGTAVYDPGAATLTLTNATIDAGCDIPGDIAITFCESGIFTLVDLHIVLIGNNFIEDTEGMGIDAYAFTADEYWDRIVSDIQISGGGTLTITETAMFDGYGIYTNGALAIDDVTLYINSRATGIWAGSALSVTNSLIIVTTGDRRWYYGIAVREGSALFDGSVLVGNIQPLIEYGWPLETSFIVLHDTGFDYSLINGGLIIAYNPEIGPFTEGTDASISSEPDGVACWAVLEDKHGIVYSNGDLTGFAYIPGVTVIPSEIGPDPGDLTIEFVEPSVNNSYLSWDVTNNTETTMTFTAQSSGQAKNVRYTVGAGATLQIRTAKVPGENKMTISWDTNAGVVTAESFAVDYTIQSLNAKFDNAPNKNYHDWTIENPNGFRVTYQWTVLETGAGAQKSLDLGVNNLRILSPQMDNYTLVISWSDEYGVSHNLTLSGPGGSGLPEADALSISFVESSINLGTLSWNITNNSNAAVAFTAKASGQTNSVSYTIGADATLQLRAAKIPGENKMTISWNSYTGIKTAESFALDYTVKHLSVEFDRAPNKNYHDWIVENPNGFRVAYQCTVLETGASIQKSVDPGVNNLRILAPQLDSYTIVITWNDEYGNTHSLHTNKATDAILTH